MAQPGPTHAALLTPPGRGGIAVIGVWGIGAGQAASSVFDARGNATPGHGQLQFGQLHDQGQPIDEAILCHWPDRVEISIHSGPAVTRAALEALQRVGAQVVWSPSQANGDSSAPLFARFLAGGAAHPKWDNQAITSELKRTLPQLRSLCAVRAVSMQWSNGLSRLARQALAALDDPAEPAGVHDVAQGLIAAADRYRSMRRLIVAAEVVLAGPPNAGKSTLANALVGRPVSLVDEQPGTTRDWVRELALLGGVPVYLTDTAGLWDSADPLDAQAVRRSRARAMEADVVVLVEPGPARVPPWLATKDVLAVWSKADAHAAPPGALAVSGTTGEGLGELAATIRRRLGVDPLDPQAPSAFTQRQVDLLRGCAAALDSGDTPTARSCLAALLTG